MYFLCIFFVKFINGLSNYTPIFVFTYISNTITIYNTVTSMHKKIAYYYLSTIICMIIIIKKLIIVYLAYCIFVCFSLSSPFLQNPPYHHPLQFHFFKKSISPYQTYFFTYFLYKLHWKLLTTGWLRYMRHNLIYLVTVIIIITNKR